MIRISSNTYIQDYLQSCRQYFQQEFRKKFSEIDLLLFDDAQYLKKCKKTQLELLQSVDSILERGGRIVFSSTTAMQDDFQKTIVDKVRDVAFVKIDSPSKGSRAQLLRYLTGKSGIHLEKEPFDYVIDNSTTSIRSLKGDVEALRAADEEVFKSFGLKDAKSILLASS